MTQPDSGEYLRARTIRNVENPMKPDSGEREVCGSVIANVNDGPLHCDLLRGHDGAHEAKLAVPTAERTGTMACPICGVASPHQHTTQEIEEWNAKRLAWALGTGEGNACANCEGPSHDPYPCPTDAQYIKASNLRAFLRRGEGISTAETIELLVAQHQKDDARIEELGRGAADSVSVPLPLAQRILAGMESAARADAAVGFEATAYILNSLAAELRAIVERKP